MIRVQDNQPNGNGILEMEHIQHPRTLYINTVRQENILLA